MKSALILGISGQIGSYLAESLLSQGYFVHGLKRKSSSLNTQRIDHIFDNPNLKLHYGDILDFSSIASLINKIKPDYVYNLVAQSHVKLSFDMPIYSVESVVMGTLNCLEAIRQFSPETRLLHSASSEMFGGIEFPQNEKTAFRPQSPYAVAKLAASQLVNVYRDAYKMFAVNSITFNTESPRRLITFVPKKITVGATRIKEGLQKKLVLGNLKAMRDWNAAEDTVRGMQLIIEAEHPKDYVIGSGETHSVQELVELVFGKLNLDWKQYVEIDHAYFRPLEVNRLEADSSLIRKELGWEPKITFEQLVDNMIAYDLKLAKQEKILAAL